MSSESATDAPLRVFRPTRRILFFFIHLLLTLVGMLGVALLLLDVSRAHGGNLLDALLSLAWVLIVFLPFGLPPLVRRRRLFTAVYADRVVVSNVWRTHTVPRADLRGAERGTDGGEWIIYLCVANGHHLCPTVVQYARRAEQDEFIALIERLVVESRT